MPCRAFGQSQKKSLHSAGESHLTCWHASKHLRGRSPRLFWIGEQLVLSVTIKPEPERVWDQSFLPLESHTVVLWATRQQAWLLDITSPPSFCSSESCKCQGRCSNCRKNIPIHPPATGATPDCCRAGAPSRCQKHPADISSHPMGCEGSTLSEGNKTLIVYISMCVAVYVQCWIQQAKV
jgi:hypothetical protein